MPRHFGKAVFFSSTSWPGEEIHRHFFFQQGVCRTDSSAALLLRLEWPTAQPFRSHHVLRKASADIVMHVVVRNSTTLGRVLPFDLLQSQLAE